MQVIVIGLFLLFVAAKLFGSIDWSWWWVASPLIIYTVVFWSITALFAVFGFVVFRR